MATYEHDIYHHTSVTTNTFSFTHAHRNAEPLEYKTNQIFICRSRHFQVTSVPVVTLGIRVLMSAEVRYIFTLDISIILYLIENTKS